MFLYGGFNTRHMTGTLIKFDLVFFKYQRVLSQFLNYGVLILMAADGVLILMAAYGLLGYLEDCKEPSFK